MKATISLAIAAVMTLGTFDSGAQTPGTVQQMDPKSHRDLMPVHAKLMEEQKLQDAEIDKLLKEVKSVKGEQRVDALVAVVEKLIEQRRAMQEKILARLDK